MTIDGTEITKRARKEAHEWARAVNASDMPTRAKVLANALADFATFAHVGAAKTVLPPDLSGDALVAWPFTATLTGKTKLQDRALRNATGDLERGGWIGRHHRRHINTSTVIELRRPPADLRHETSGTTSGNLRHQMPEPPDRTCRSLRIERAGASGSNVPEVGADTPISAPARSEEITYPINEEGTANAGAHAPDPLSDSDDDDDDPESSDYVETWSAPLSRNIAGKFAKLRGLPRPPDVERHADAERFRGIARNLVERDRSGDLVALAAATWCVERKRIPGQLTDDEVDEVDAIYDRLDTQERARHEAYVRDRAIERGIDPDTGEYVSEAARLAAEQRERDQERAELVERVTYIDEELAELQAKRETARAAVAAFDAQHATKPSLARGQSLADDLRRVAQARRHAFLAEPQTWVIERLARESTGITDTTAIVERYVEVCSGPTYAGLVEHIARERESESIEGARANYPKLVLAVTRQHIEKGETMDDESRTEHDTRARGTSIDGAA